SCPRRGSRSRGRGLAPHATCAPTLVLAGAWCSLVVETAPRRRSAVGTIAVPARRTGDFRLRFHDALAPAAPPGLSSSGRLSVNGCPSLPDHRIGEPPVTGGVAAASVMPPPMRSIGSR